MARGVAMERVVAESAAGKGLYGDRSGHLVSLTVEIRLQLEGVGLHEGMKIYTLHISLPRM